MNIIPTNAVNQKNDIILENIYMYTLCMKNPRLEKEDYDTCGAYFADCVRKDNFTVENIKSGNYGVIDYDDFGWVKYTVPTIKYDKI